MVQEKSRATGPSLKGLIKRRKNLSGTSVTVITISARTRTRPRGRNCGFTDRTKSKTNLAIKDQSRISSAHWSIATTIGIEILLWYQATNGSQGDLVRATDVEVVGGIHAVDLWFAFFIHDYVSWAE
jgi:putative N-acetylmannosamine-6-phosphate epimerase